MPKQRRWSLVDAAHQSSNPRTQQVQEALAVFRQQERYVKTKVNLSIGLKPNLAFRLSFGLKA